ncbi:MAG: helix-turn-helix domain-containing protein [Rikenellaceae bacterium]
MNRLKIEQFEVWRGDNFISSTTIFYCTAGSAKILLNGVAHDFGAATNFIILDSAHLLFVECSDDFRCTTITFGGKTFNRIYTHMDSSIVTRLCSSAPDIAALSGYRASNLTLEKILLINESDSEYRDTMMRSQVMCYIYESYDLISRTIEQTTEDHTSIVNNITSRFLILCKEHHTLHREIEFYARELAISRRYLHTVVVEKLHASPKEVIDGFAISSAKRLLLTTTMSAVQIADELNFSDSSAFGQFFKRIIKMSPSQFRKKHA